MDEVITANKGTLQTLAARKEAIETGNWWGPPAVSPLVHQNAVFERRMDITIGEITVELHNVNIHTPDSVVAYIPKDNLDVAVVGIKAVMSHCPNLARLSICSTTFEGFEMKTTKSSIVSPGSTILSLGI